MKTDNTDYYYDLSNWVDVTSMDFDRRSKYGRRSFNLFKKYGLKLMQSILDGSWTIYRASDNTWSIGFTGYGNVEVEGMLKNYFIISENGKFNAINIETLEIANNSWYKSEDELYMCWNYFIG